MTSSEAWNCSRRIKFEKTTSGKGGFPNWGMAERGNIIEKWAVEMMRIGMPNDLTLLCAGDQQVTFTHGAQSGTPDGIIRLPDYKLIVWELKSIHPNTKRSNLPKERHLWQLQQNMDLVNNCMGNVYGGLITYIDASDLKRVNEYAIQWDDDLCDALIVKARNIMQADDPSKLPAEGMHMQGQCDECAFTEQCSEAMQMEQGRARQMRIAERAMKNVFK